MRRHRASGAGGLVVGLVLIAIGTYYVLTNTLGIDLPELDGDMIWPIIVMAIGVLIVFRATRDQLGHHQP